MLLPLHIHPGYEIIHISPDNFNIIYNFLFIDVFAIVKWLLFKLLRLFSLLYNTYFFFHAL